MLRSINRHKSVLCVCAVVASAALLLSWAGCRGKQTKSAYGPGHDWVNDMRERVQEQFDDPDMVADLLLVVDQIEGTVIELDQNVTNYYVALTKLDKNYHSTREEFQTVIDQFNKERDEAFDEVSGYAFKMKMIAGREGWKKLSDIDKTLYEEWQRAYEQEPSGKGSPQ
jgi:hypothetical protein